MVAWLTLCMIGGCVRGAREGNRAGGSGERAMMKALLMGISARLGSLRAGRDTTETTMVTRTLAASGFLGLLMILPWMLAGGTAEGVQSTENNRMEQRAAMVKEQIEKRGIHDPRVLAAMRSVPRHRFVPTDLEAQAYGDYPLPIGWEQTISQPYIVALMADLLEAKGDEKVLEIGTGSGYHAAVMAQLVKEVFTIEIVEPLGQRAAETLRKLGIDNVHVRVGDGFGGWPEAAPFDAIVLTAAPPVTPKPLLQQLRMGGRMILPLGRGTQDLVVLTRTPTGFKKRIVTAVRFVPMTGIIQGEDS